MKDKIKKFLSRAKVSSREIGVLKNLNSVRSGELAIVYLV